VKAITYIPLAKREVASRVVLAPLFVAVCYLSEWWKLRLITVFVLLRLSAFLHLPMQGVSGDLISLDGLQIQFGIACTMVDAFFGSIPLLWRLSGSWHWNVARLAAIFGGVFLLNIFRLELGFIALHYGAPWWLAHECVAGIAYFCVFLFVMRNSGKSKKNKSRKKNKI